MIALWDMSQKHGYNMFTKHGISMVHVQKRHNAIVNVPKRWCMLNKTQWHSMGEEMTEFDYLF